MKYFIDENTGSCYAIVDNELVQFPMSTDGTFSTDDSAVVDWDFIDTELPLTIDGVEVELYKHMREVEDKLK